MPQGSRPRNSLPTSAAQDHTGGALGVLSYSRPRARILWLLLRSLALPFGPAVSAATSARPAPAPRMARSVPQEKHHG